ncbi:hypothetical protein I4U23_001799 [Adineta vaga]|nr:hypothetical protein I4U23_001799 [Adineta vaga]
MTTTILNHSDWDHILPFDELNYTDLFPALLDSAPHETYNQDHLSDVEQYIHLLKSDESHLQQTHDSQIETLQCDLICRVCGAPATGYNFDQITCESCKAFFRRNALRETSDLKCHFSGSCIINIHTRRQCTYCRLKKCFDIKMRKDWIRTEEETKLRQLQKLMKQERKRNKSGCDAPPVLNLPLVVRKKKRLMIKSGDVDQSIFSVRNIGFHGNLDEADNILLNNITHAYQSTANQTDGLRFNHYNESMSLIQFLDKESAIHKSLIEFYKKIPQFKQLNLDDEVRLIKSNLINIIHLHDILIQNFSESPSIGYFMSKWIHQDFHHHMSQARQCLYRFYEHPLILKLALIVFIFTIYECNDYSDKFRIEELHEFFIALLWRYLKHLYSEDEAIQSMDIIKKQILQFQTLMNVMEDIVRREKSTNISDQLMQCVFRLE